MAPSGRHPVDSYSRTAAALSVRTCRTAESYERISATAEDSSRVRVRVRGSNPRVEGLVGATVVNLSPAVADELGVDPFLGRGVMITNVGRGFAMNAGFRPGPQPTPEPYGQPYGQGGSFLGTAAAAHAAWRAAEAAPAQAEADVASAEQDRDWLEHAVAELNGFAPEAGEEEMLASARTTMQKGARLADELASVAAHLGGSDGALAELGDAP